MAHIKPTHVVFYTYNFYAHAVREIRIEGGGLWLEVEDGHRACGAKRLGWWTLEIDTPWGTPMHVLVTGHPERMKQEAYVGLVAGWIAETGPA
jgi:hypothetical protein